MRTARRRYVPASLLAVTLLTGCAASGVASATQDEAFSSCLDTAAAASYDGAEDWDEVDQLAFWGRHGTLLCAVDEQLARAIGDAFADPADTDDRTEVANGQALAVRTLATDVAESQGEDAAVAAVAAVVRAGWYDDAEDSSVVRRLAAFTILTVNGETKDYGAYRERNAGSTYDDIELDLDYAQDIALHRAETEQVADRLATLSEAIADAA